VNICRHESPKNSPACPTYRLSECVICFDCRHLPCHQNLAPTSSNIRPSLPFSQEPLSFSTSLFLRRNSAFGLIFLKLIVGWQDRGCLEAAIQRDRGAVMDTPPPVPHPTPACPRPLLRQPPHGRPGRRRRPLPRGPPVRPPAGPGHQLTTAQISAPAPDCACKSRRLRSGLDGRYLLMLRDPRVKTADSQSLSPAGRAGRVSPTAPTSCSWTRSSPSP